MFEKLDRPLHKEACPAMSVVFPFPTLHFMWFSVLRSDWLYLSLILSRGAKRGQHIILPKHLIEFKTNQIYLKKKESDQV